MCCPTDRIVNQLWKGQSYRFCCPERTEVVRGPQIHGGEACCPVGASGRLGVGRDCCNITPDGDDDLVPLTPKNTKNGLGRLGVFCVNAKKTKL
ncbi:MAG: hypothetical protein ACKVUT_02315 [Gaiella sp.]